MVGPNVPLAQVFPERPLDVRDSYTGVFRAKVKDIDDREEEDNFLGRIKVWVPQVYGEDYEDKVEDLPWAWPVFMHAGKDADGIKAGFLAMPRVDSWVYVLFEGGDPDRPIWFGGWYGQDEDGESELSDALIEDDRSSARYPVIIGWVSPWGGKIKIRVLPGSSSMEDERFEIVFGDLDDPDVIFELDSVGYPPNTVPVVRLETKWAAKIKATENIDLETEETLTIRCKKLDVQATDEIAMASGGSSSYSATGTNTFAGSAIKGQGTPNGGFDKWGVTRRAP